MLIQISYLLYISIGLVLATILYYIYLFVLKKEILGHIYTALLVGVIGSIVGGNLLRQPIRLTINYFHNYQIEIFAYITGFFLGLLLFYTLFLIAKFLSKEDFPFKVIGSIIFATLGTIIGGIYLTELVQIINKFFLEHHIEFFASFIGSLILLFVYILISASIKKQY